MNAKRDIVGDIFIKKEDIARRVTELGAEISRDYRGKQLVLVGILKGAVVFFSDLVRAIEGDVRFDFMAVSSYGSTTESTGTVKINKDLDISIEGKDVLIVEDIIDSGLTLSYLLEFLAGRKPNTVRTCCMFDKPDRRKVNLKPDYVGMRIPDAFIVGYGLDYAEKYRNLPDVRVVEFI